MKCEKVSINYFMEVWFEQNYEHLSKDDFDIVYSEYVDLAGLYQSKEFELVTYINYLKNRTYVLKTIIVSQEMYFQTFKIPYIHGFKIIKDKFGYNFTWTGDETLLFSFLRKLRNDERKKSAELRRKEYEYEQLKLTKHSDNKSLIQTRHEFIRMLNSFNKAGYKIDRDKTTIEELALMIKQVNDENERLELERFKTR
jgi:hypothetical protein